MKRSIVLAALLTLVLAATASSSESSVSFPSIYPAGNGFIYLMYFGLDGDTSVDGIVGYGAGTGPRDVSGPPAENETDGAEDYGVGTGPRAGGPPAENETDGVVDYGVGSGPRSGAQGKTN